MPTILRGRIALAVLVGVFLIPLGVSTLRGLTHALTCRSEVATPFTFILGGPAEPSVAVSSTAVAKEAPAALCGGLTVEPRAGVIDEERVRLVVPITNHSDFPWRGTVLLRVQDVDVPVDVGEVGPGATESGTVQLRLDPGQLLVQGSLLIGP